MIRRATRRATVVTAVAVALGAVALPALAFLTFSVTRGASFTAGSLAGSSVTVPQLSSGTVTVSWAAVAAPGGGPVDGYYVERTAGASTAAACATSPEALTTALSCNDAAPAGTYTYRVTAVFRSWSTPASSSAVLVDTTAPEAFAPVLSAATGNTFVNGSTVYTNPKAGLSGGFTVSATPVDGESQIKHVTFPVLAGFTSGGGSDAAAPYATTYAWAGTAATATGPQDVVAVNNALTPTTGTFTVTPDTASPTGGAVTAGNSGTGTVAVTSTAFADAGSGMATNVLTRASAGLAGGTCGAYTGAAEVTVSGGNDTAALATGCYQYTLTGTDRVGNQAVTTAVAKVDTTAPAFTITATGTNVGTDGSTVYFRSGSGSFTLTVADAESGVAAVTFPTFAGWTAGGSGNTRTYTLSGASAGAAAAASATNGAGGVANRTITTVLQNVTPAAADVQGAGNGNGILDAGDSLTLTFNTVVNPATIASGWDGAARSVTLDPANSSSNDTATVTGTSLGTVELGGNYVGNGVGNDYALPATMSVATVGGKTVVTITVTGSDAKALAASGTPTLRWATTTAVRDFGNAAATITPQATETGGTDGDF